MQKSEIEGKIANIAMQVSVIAIWSHLLQHPDSASRTIACSLVNLNSSMPYESVEYSVILEVKDSPTSA